MNSPYTYVFSHQGPYVFVHLFPSRITRRVSDRFLCCYFLFALPWPKDQVIQYLGRIAGDFWTSLGLLFLSALVNLKILKAMYLADTL